LNGMIKSIFLRLATALTSDGQLRRKLAISEIPKCL